MSLTKTTLAAATAAALVLAPVTAFADGHGNGHGHGHSATHANHGKSKMHFTANGKVTAVSDASFTMHVKGGSKALHGTDVTVALSDNAKVRRNGAKAEPWIDDTLRCLGPKQCARVTGERAILVAGQRTRSADDEELLQRCIVAHHRGGHGDVGVTRVSNVTKVELTIQLGLEVQPL